MMKKYCGTYTEAARYLVPLCGKLLFYVSVTIFRVVPTVKYKLVPSYSIVPSTGVVKFVPG
jgi:hypothetical protein